MALSQAGLARAMGVPPSRVSEWAKRGMPLEVEAAKIWRLAHAPPRLQPKEPEIPPPLPEVIAGNNSWEARIARAKAAEAQLYAAIRTRLDVADARELNKLRFSHLRAVERIAELERQALEVQLSRGQLLSATDVRAIWSALLPPLKMFHERDAPNDSSSLAQAEMRPSAASPGPWVLDLLARIEAVSDAFRGTLELTPSPKQ